MHRVREIVQSGELGAVKRLDGALTVPSGWFPRDDVRYDWTMGGGCMMDMGGMRCESHHLSAKRRAVYPLSFIRWLLDAEPISVISASAIPAHTSTPSAPLDRGTTALLSFPNDVTASLTCDSATPLPWGIKPKVEMKIECERGSVYILNFVQPTAYHYVTWVTVLYLYSPPDPPSQSSPAGEATDDREDILFRTFVAEDAQG